MPLTTGEQYEANKQKYKRQAEEEKRKRIAVEDARQKELQAVAAKRWWHLGQRDAVARFTLWLVVVTAILVGVTALSIFVLIETDKTNRNINRAFLTSYKLKINQIGEGDQTNWEISPILENAGNTSAADIRSRIMRIYFSPVWQMRNVKIGGGDPDFTDLEFDGLPGASLSLAPHGQTELGTLVITDLARSMIKIKSMNVFLFGEAEYFDVFSRWHRTKFCYRLIGSTVTVEDENFGQASNVGQFGFFVPGRVETVRNTLNYRLCRRNNCVDEQCGERKERPENDHPNLTVLKTFSPMPNTSGNRLIDIEIKK